MTLAIIPARGGSKRIPRKNVKLFNGKPMIAWSIEVAKASSLFKHIIVTTDDAEIAEIAKSFGAEVPFMRPTELSDDFTATAPVIAHAIRECESYGWLADMVCCIYPASPLIQINDLMGAYDLLIKSSADYVFPVTRYTSAIQRAFQKNSDGYLFPINPEFEISRTQDLSPAYYDTGQFYWGKKSSWLAHKQIFTHGLGYEVPNWRVVDIDDNDDWRLAEIIFDKLRVDDI